PGQRLEPAPFDPNRRCRAEADAVDDDVHLPRERAQGPQHASRCAEAILRDDLHDVDTIEVRHDPRGQFGPPRHAEPIAITCHRPRPLRRTPRRRTTTRTTTRRTFRRTRRRSPPWETASPRTGRVRPAAR